MFDYVYTDHAQYTIKTYAKMTLFPVILTGPLSIDSMYYSTEVSTAWSVEERFNETLCCLHAVIAVCALHRFDAAAGS